MSGLKAYGWDAVKLSALSFEELAALRAAVVDDPSSANPRHANGSIHLYTKAARRKLDALTWAVFYKMQEGAEG